MCVIYRLDAMIFLSKVKTLHVRIVLSLGLAISSIENSESRWRRTGQVQSPNGLFEESLRGVESEGEVFWALYKMKKLTSEI